MLAHFSSNLRSRHFVDRFQFDSDAPEFFGLEAFEKLALRFTGTEDQNCVGSPNRSNDVIIVIVAVVPELSL